MRFAFPLYLLLFVPLIVGLVFSFRHMHGIAKARKRLAFGIRFLLVGCLIVAIAGPEARRPNDGLATMFVLDRSDSVSDKDKQRAEEFVRTALAELAPADVGGVVAFGRNAVIDAAPGGRRTLGQVISDVDAGASDLAGAMRLASAAFPEGKSKRIVVLTDANETNGDAAEAALAAAADGIEVDYVSLGAEERKGEASIVALETPNEMREDQPFDLRVIVESTTEQQALIEVDRDGVRFKQVQARLSPGMNSILIADRLTESGFHRYRATLRSQGDLDNRNNVGLGFVAVRGKPRVLVLQGDPSTSPLATALRGSGIQVDVGGPSNIPTRAEGVQVYDAVFLNDINASNFTNGQMEILRSAVRDTGVGFAMVGGEDSFLPGGYYGSIIAEILPVDLNIRQRKTFPSTSICIMADASGSMGMVEDGVEKIRLAAKAAEETVKLLSPMDRVGVAGSTDGIEFVAPMQLLTDKGKVISQIRKLSTGGGGIYIYPSIVKAEEVLKKEDTKVRHFILLADGDDSDSQEGSLGVALRMRAQKITTTVVSIGDGKDVPFLKRLAAAGGGRFYLAKKASQLPAIFTQDAAIMSRSAIEEGAFIPRLSASEEILAGIVESGTPPLLAYCLADGRPLASIGMRSPKEDPILAKWQVGLGTSLAFMSDAQPRWASRWVGWEGFGTFWSQAARGVSRRTTLNNYDVSVRNEGGRGIVEVRAADRLGNPLSATDATVRVAAPDGTFHELGLQQQAPGTFTSAFEAGAIGTYIVTVAEPDGKGSRAISTGFSLPYPPEYRSHLTNSPLLASIAEVTKGRQLSEPRDALRPVATPGASIAELWHLFVLAAALLLPLDIGVRRIALPLGEILGHALSWLRRRRVQEVSPQAQTVDRLQRAKERARAPVTGVQSVTRIEATPDDVAHSAPSKQGESAANSLLDAKRRRSKGE